MSQTNLESLSFLLKDKIKNFSTGVSQTEEGRIISLADGIA